MNFIFKSSLLDLKFDLGWACFLTKFELNQIQTLKIPYTY